MSGQNPNQPPHYASADNHNPYSNPWGETPDPSTQNTSQSHNPFHPPPQQPHDTNPFAQEPSYNPPSGPPPDQHHSHTQDFGASIPPNLPPRRVDTTSETALPQGQDRSHQVEVMQSYEMSRPQTEDEQNQQILQREFPNMDGSLIAAIYSDSGSLSATREMLQELNSTEDS